MIKKDSPWYYDKKGDHGIMIKKRLTKTIS